LCEHVYWTREHDEARGVLSFPPAVAPTKVLIVPLSAHADFKPFVTKLSAKLRAMRISNRVDDSGASIGKRYAVRHITSVT
jgi:glycyl-tRNA synthetase